MDPIKVEKLVDIWLNHSDKMWKAVYATPIIGASILVGWFSMHASNEVTFSRLVLGLGCFSMFIQWMIISRMAQFDGALFTAIKKQMPDIGKPVGGLNGKQIAKLVPGIFGAIYLILFLIDLCSGGANTNSPCGQSNV